MPCYSIQRSKIEFLATSTDETLLAKAMEALGATDWIFNKTDGKLKLPANIEIDAVKRAYSKHVVLSQAAKFGWQLKWETNAAGNEEASVIRRV